MVQSYDSILSGLDVSVEHVEVDPLAPIPDRRRSPWKRWGIASLIVVSVLAVSVAISGSTVDNRHANNAPIMFGVSATMTTNSTPPPAPKEPIAVEGMIDVWDSWKRSIVHTWHQITHTTSDEWNETKHMNWTTHCNWSLVQNYSWNSNHSIPNPCNISNINANLNHLWNDSSTESSTTMGFSFPNASSYHWNFTKIRDRLEDNSWHWKNSYLNGSIKFGSSNVNGSDVIMYMNHSGSFDLLVDAFADAAPSLEYSKDYFQVLQGMDAQVNQAYCGVATSAAIMNSFRGDIVLPVDHVYSPYPYAVQADILNTTCVSANVVRINSTFNGILAPPGGLVLDQVKSLLECSLPASATLRKVHVNPSIVSIDQMRQDMKDALLDPNSRVLINFDRAAVGQAGGGHFSPLGSYSSSKDAFLVMDVAKYKYPMSWIPTDLLYQSLSTFDACGNWNYPSAQDGLPSESIFTVNASQYLAAVDAVGCQPAHRGYMIVAVE